MEKNLWPKASEELLLQAFKTIEATINQMQADAEAEQDAGLAESAYGGTADGSSSADPSKPKTQAATMRPVPPLTGRISADKLQELLSLHGEPLKQTELEDFMKACLFYFTHFILTSSSISYPSLERSNR